jgi:myo-inositol-1(or 4)-monophosphatase
MTEPGEASEDAEPGDLVDELVTVACRLAVEGGDRAMTGRGGRPLDITTKSTATDLVTVLDRAAEETIVAGLADLRPTDAILGEEGTHRDGTSGVSWFVDPIDGTTNFVYGIPQWATSVAAGDADGTLAGAVYVPAMGELFAAGRGRGASLNGAPITCSGRTDVSLALVATGFSYRPAERRRQAAVVEHLIGSVRDIRRIGSAAIDLCYAACGRVDAYYEAGLNPWDVTAGELIAREAGCRSGDFDGGPPSADRLLVATPAIFDELVRLLASR